MTAPLEGGEWSAARPGRTLLPGKTRYPFYRRLGGPQGRSGRTEKSHPHRDSIPDRSHSLYRLSYLAHADTREELKISNDYKVRDVLNLDINCFITTIVEQTVTRKLKWIFGGVGWKVVDSIHLVRSKAQGDIFSFTSVTKDKIIWVVVACLLYLLCFVLMLLRALPSLVVAVQQCCTATTGLGRARNNINPKHNKYNRHATTNQIILSLVTEVKEKISP